MRKPDNPDGRNERRSAEHRYEWPDDTDLSVAVIEAVASVSGRDPTEIEPMYEYVDPDALDALFESGERRTAGSTVSFPVADHLVVAHSDGEIAVYPRD